MFMGQSLDAVEVNGHFLLDCGVFNATNVQVLDLFTVIFTNSVQIRFQIRGTPLAVSLVPRGLLILVFLGFLRTPRMETCLATLI